MLVSEILKEGLLHKQSIDMKLLHLSRLSIEIKLINLEHLRNNHKTWIIGKEWNRNID